LIVVFGSLFYQNSSFLSEISCPKHQIQYFIQWSDRLKGIESIKSSSNDNFGNVCQSKEINEDVIAEEKQKQGFEVAETKATKAIQNIQ
jgi:hypothetical protein